MGACEGLASTEQPGDEPLHFLGVEAVAGANRSVAGHRGCQGVAGL